MFSSWALSAQLAFEKEGQIVLCNKNKGEVIITGQFKFKNVSGKVIELRKSALETGCDCTSAIFSQSTVKPNEDAFVDVKVTYNFSDSNDPYVDELKADHGFFCKEIQVNFDNYFVLLYFSGMVKGVK
jgi:hypothetical protein